MSARNYGIGVVSRSHVRLGVEGGFIQLDHGKKAPLQRFHAGYALFREPADAWYEVDPSYEEGQIEVLAQDPDAHLLRFAQAGGRGAHARNEEAAQGSAAAEEFTTKKGHDMTDPASLVSEAFQAFMREAPEHAQAWGAAVSGLAKASALDKKTSALAYLAVLAAQRLESRIPFHVQVAKDSGASRDEVISAILVGLPATGLGVTQVLPAAIAAYDAA